MKKLVLSLMALLSLAFTTKAQQYVSTEPSTKNVVIEYYTGRNCGYCPIAHRVTREIMDDHPGRVYTVAYHCGSYSPTSRPNCNISFSSQHANAFHLEGTPEGVFNRNTASANGITTTGSNWKSAVNQLLNQDATCNIAGVATVNPETRKASITVEVYYTDNSAVDNNYLTVVMVQDSIIGSQADYGDYNPGGWVGTNLYSQMNVLRDIITANWGDAISPTTQGTLITKNYEYTIPESIGSPNGVDVDLDNIRFIAFVSEKYQGTPTRPVLNACQLVTKFVTDHPIHPMIKIVKQAPNASCDQIRSFYLRMINAGTEEITSMKYETHIGETNNEFEWTGNLASGDVLEVEFDIELPFGVYDESEFVITEVNGTACEFSKTFDAECIEWIEIEEESETTSLKIYIIQDQYGEQTTWDIVNSNGEKIAEGGPYQHLAGSGSTLINVEDVDNIPTDDCYSFRIFDSGKNGICCTYGQGYYFIKDAKNTKIIQGDGDFGAKKTHQFYVKRGEQDVTETEASRFSVYPNPANDKIYVEGEGIEIVELYNAIGQQLVSVAGSEKITIDVTSFSEGVYFVKVIGKETMTQKVVIK